MYIYHSRTKRRVTVVGVQENGVLKLAVARCGSQNAFNKKTGRSIAIQRLANNHLYANIKIDEKPLNNKEFVDLAKTYATQACAVPTSINGREYKGNKLKAGLC